MDFHNTSHESLEPKTCEIEHENLSVRSEMDEDKGRNSFNPVNNKTIILHNIDKSKFGLIKSDKQKLDYYNTDDQEGKDDDSDDNEELDETNLDLNKRLLNQGSRSASLSHINQSQTLGLYSGLDDIVGHNSLFDKELLYEKSPETEPKADTLSDISSHLKGALSFGLPSKGTFTKSRVSTNFDKLHVKTNGNYKGRVSSSVGTGGILVYRPSTPKKARRDAEKSPQKDKLFKAEKLEKKKEGENIDHLSEELQIGFRILSELMVDSLKTYNNIFMEPIELDAKINGDYLEVVKNPIWLPKIKENLLKGDYKNITELVSAIRLMLENTYRYFGTVNAYSRKALRMEFILEQKLNLLSREMKAKCSLEVTHGVSQEEFKELNRVKGSRITVNGDNYFSYLLYNVRGCRPAREKELRVRRVEAMKKAKIDKEREMVEWEGNLFDGPLGGPLRNMWEIPQISQFLFLSSRVLNISEVSIYELERILMVPEISVTLCMLMTSLVSSPQQRAKLAEKPYMPYNIWARKFAHKAYLWYKVYYRETNNPEKVYEQLGIEPMFWKVCGRKNPFDTHLFHEMTLYQRIWLLKSLCDYISHNHKSVQEAIAEQPEENQRESILGRDRQGNEYIHFPQIMGGELRIYRRTPIRCNIDITLEEEVQSSNILFTRDQIKSFHKLMKKIKKNRERDNDWDFVQRNHKKTLPKKKKRDKKAPFWAVTSTPTTVEKRSRPERLRQTPKARYNQQNLLNANYDFDSSFDDESVNLRKKLKLSRETSLERTNKEDADLGDDDASIKGDGLEGESLQHDAVSKATENGEGNEVIHNKEVNLPKKRIPISCKTCGKKFSTKSAMYGHTAMHVRYKTSASSVTESKEISEDKKTAKKNKKNLKRKKEESVEDVNSFSNLKVKPNSENCEGKVNIFSSMENKDDCSKDDLTHLKETNDDITDSKLIKVKEDFSVKEEKEDAVEDDDQKDVTLSKNKTIVKEEKLKVEGKENISTFIARGKIKDACDTITRDSSENSCLVDIKHLDKCNKKIKKEEDNIDDVEERIKNENGFLNNLDEDNGVSESSDTFQNEDKNQCSSPSISEKKTDLPETPLTSNSDNNNDTNISAANGKDVDNTMLSDTEDDQPVITQPNPTDFELVASTVMELRNLISKFGSIPQKLPRECVEKSAEEDGEKKDDSDEEEKEIEDDDVDKDNEINENEKITAEDMKRPKCEEKLHKALCKLLAELAPFESKMLSSFKQARRKLWLEYLDWKKRDADFVDPAEEAWLSDPEPDVVPSTTATPKPSSSSSSSDESLNDDGTRKRKLRKRRAKVSIPRETSPVEMSAEQPSVESSDQEAVAVSSRGRVRKVKKIFNYDKMDFEKLAQQSKKEAMEEKERRKKKREEELNENAFGRNETGNLTQLPTTGIKRCILNRVKDVVGNDGKLGTTYGRENYVKGVLKSKPETSSHDQNTLVTEATPKLVVSAVNEEGKPVYVRVFGDQALRLITIIEQSQNDIPKQIKLQRFSQSYSFSTDSPIMTQNIPGYPDSDVNNPSFLNNASPVRTNSNIMSSTELNASATSRVSSSLCSTVATSPKSVIKPLLQNVRPPNAVAIAYQGLPTQSQPAIAPSIHSTSSCASLSSTTKLVTATPSVVPSVPPITSSSQIKTTIGGQQSSSSAPMSSIIVQTDKGQQIKVNFASDQIAQLVQKTGQRMVAIPNGKGGYALTFVTQTPKASPSKTVVSTGSSIFKNIESTPKIAYAQVGSSVIKSPVQLQIPTSTFSQSKIGVMESQQRISSPTSYSASPQVVSISQSPSVSRQVIIQSPLSRGSSTLVQPQQQIVHIQPQNSQKVLQVVHSGGRQQLVQMIQAGQIIMSGNNIAALSNVQQPAGIVMQQQQKNTSVIQQAPHLVLQQSMQEPTTKIYQVASQDQFIQQPHQQVVIQSNQPQQQQQHIILQQQPAQQMHQAPLQVATHIAQPQNIQQLTQVNRYNHTDISGQVLQDSSSISGLNSQQLRASQPQQVRISQQNPSAQIRLSHQVQQNVAPSQQETHTIVQTQQVPQNSVQYSQMLHRQVAQNTELVNQTLEHHSQAQTVQIQQQQSPAQAIQLQQFHNHIVQQQIPQARVAQQQVAVQHMQQTVPQQPKEQVAVSSQQQPTRTLQQGRIVLIQTNEGQRVGLQMPDGRLTLLSAEQLQPLISNGTIKIAS